jgi:hypothetical protein
MCKKIAVAVLLLTCIGSVGATKKILSPKASEFNASLGKTMTKTAPMPIIPLIVLPPPNTNRYYLKLVWDVCTSPMELNWGTQSLSYQFTNTFTGTNGNLSNLLYGTTYFFRTTTNCGLADSELRFPPVRPPFTNWVWIGATNWAGRTFTNPIPDQQFYRVTNGQFQAFNSLSGQWLQIGTVTGTAPITLISVVSNNQPNFAQYMHKQ